MISRVGREVISVGAIKEVVVVDEGGGGEGGEGGLEWLWGEVVVALVLCSGSEASVAGSGVLRGRVS